MKKICTLILCVGIISLSAQTTLYTENFESGGAGTFTLNTTDVGSSASAYNFWIVNNTYIGGTGALICFGFPFSYTIANTPNEPGGITNSPNSYYLHTMSQAGQADGIFCSSFAAADGFCIFDDFIFSRMTSDISTIGYTSVDFNFWWACAGGPPQIHGEVYYSTDGGIGWTQCTTPISSYSGQSFWSQTIISLPAFANQSTLRFGFKFVNVSGASAALDPGFSIDDISIVGSVSGGPTITTSAVTGSPFCAGDSIVVPYTITGTFTGGNIFTAQLSDGTGSFASPTAIGSVASTTAGNINCAIPIGATTAAGYMIRVVSSTPSVTGTSAGPITINAVPSPTANNTGPYCAPTTIQLNSPTGSATDDWSGPLGYFVSDVQNPTIASSTVPMSGVYTVTVTNAAGCSATATTTVVVLDCSGIELEQAMQLNIYPNPTSDQITISINETIVADTKISLLNLVGQTVYSINPTQGKTILSTDALGLKAGIYLVQIKYKDQTKVVRLIKR